MSNLIKITKVVIVCFMFILFLSSQSTSINREISVIEFSESVVDTNGDDLADFFVIGMDFTVTYPGEYHVYAHLYCPDSGWQLITSELFDFNVDYEDAYNNTIIHVPIYFNGLDIYNSGIDGVYLTEVLISEAASMGDVAQDSYETAFYCCNDFTNTLPLAEEPTATPGSGSYTGNQEITLSTAMSGGYILYSTDGSAPYLYYENPLIITGDTEIKAQAGKDDAQSSDVVTFTYAITPEKVATPIASPAAGAYTTVQFITLSCATPGVSIYYTLNGDTPTTSSTLYSGEIGIGSTKTLKAIAVKAGMINSDILSQTYAIDLQKVDTPTASPPGGTYVGDQYISLNVYAAAIITYTTDGTDPKVKGTMYLGEPLRITKDTTIKAYAWRANAEDSDTMTVSYNIQTAAPTASPPGGTYSSTQNVTLSCATAGVDIYYTLDGSTPTTSSTLYVSGTSIPITSTKTIKAISRKTGLTTSNVASLSYIIDFPVNKTINLSISANKEYIIPFVVQGIGDISGKTFRLTYDPSKLEIIDLAAQSKDTVTTIGLIADTDVEILSVSTNGEITFCVNKTLPAGKLWSGTINIFKFKAKSSGSTTLTCNIN